MGTNADKHARQKANREADEAPASTRSRSAIVIGAIAIIAAIGLVVWQLSPDETTVAEDTGGSAATTDGGSPSSNTSEHATDAGTDTGCPPVGGSSERVTTFEGPPPMCIDAATTRYSAAVDTTKGSFTIDLDAEAAPGTVNNFVVLSRYHYYDGVPFHRVVPGFVIQAGDGDGTPDGSNDIGYTIDDELPRSAEAYVDYSVAMANAGPDTNGSQFFVVLPGGGSQLTNAYSVFGQVTDGTDVVDAIGALGGPDQKPSEQVLINSVTITESPR